MTDRARVAGIDLVWRDLVPGRLGLWLPERPDDLLEALTEEEFRANDERMPYFASLWPAGEALARAVLDGPDLEGLSVLDLGCGLGPVGLAAARKGGAVTYLDWEPRALEVVAAAARAQGLPEGVRLAGDWRRPPPFGPFDRILAADVLYEARNVPAVAGFLASHLRPEGEAWVADTGRPQAALFPEAMAAAGIRLLEARLLPYRPAGARVDLLRIALG